MDVNGGQVTQTNGNPIFPGTTFTGPVLVGNVIRTDGTGTLASAGETTGTANVGYGVTAQSVVITQANGTTVGAPNGVATAGVYTTGIVIPAQSQILSIQLMVTTIWSGSASTAGIGATAGTTAATAFTGATAVAGGTLGIAAAILPGTAAEYANWDNVSNATFQTGGPADVQIIVTSGNTGTGVGTLTVTYLPGINNAS